MATRQCEPMRCTHPRWKEGEFAERGSPRRRCRFVALRRASRGAGCGRASVFPIPARRALEPQAAGHGDGVGRLGDRPSHAEVSTVLVRIRAAAGSGGGASAEVHGGRARTYRPTLAVWPGLDRHDRRRPDDPRTPTTPTSWSQLQWPSPARGGGRIKGPVGCFDSRGGPGDAASVNPPPMRTSRWATPGDAWEIVSMPSRRVSAGEGGNARTHDHSLGRDAGSGCGAPGIGGQPAPENYAG